MLIVANWKAYVETAKEAKALFTQTRDLAKKSKHTFVVCAPATLLPVLKESRSKVVLSAQTISTHTEGAHTGEETGMMLRDAGAEYTLVGHSERRLQGESDTQVADQAVRAFSSGLIPIVCVGEVERDERLQYLTFLREQVSTVLDALPEVKRKSVIFAYEPLWAINKGDNAITGEDLYETVAYIRKIILEYTSDAIAKKAVLLYGGSVESSNIQYLAKEGGVNGFLIGHASVDTKKLRALVGAL